MRACVRAPTCAPWLCARMVPPAPPPQTPRVRHPHQRHARSCPAVQKELAPPSVPAPHTVWARSTPHTLPHVLRALPVPRPLPLLPAAPPSTSTPRQPCCSTRRRCQAQAAPGPRGARGHAAPSCRAGQAFPAAWRRACEQAGRVSRPQEPLAHGACPASCTPKSARASKRSGTTHLPPRLQLFPCQDCPEAGSASRSASRRRRGLSSRGLLQGLEPLRARLQATISTGVRCTCRCWKLARGRHECWPGCRWAAHSPQPRHHALTCILACGSSMPNRSFRFRVFSASMSGCDRPKRSARLRARSASSSGCVCAKHTHQGAQLGMQGEAGPRHAACCERLVRSGAAHNVEALRAGLQLLRLWVLEPEGQASVHACA